VPRNWCFPGKKRRAGWEERVIFIHIFGGFRKPPKIWIFLVSSRLIAPVEIFYLSLGGSLKVYEIASLFFLPFYPEWL